MGNATRARSAVGSRSTGPIDTQSIRADAFYYTNSKSIEFELGDEVVTTDAIQDWAGPTITNQMTISQWSKNTLTGRSFDMIYGNHSTSGLTNGFGAYWTSQSLTAHWGAYNGSSKVIWVAPSDAYVKAWHHYVFVYDGDLSTERVKLYVDGVMEVSATGSDIALTAANQSLKIGSGDHDAAYDMQGNVDEFAMWNIPLTQEDITSLYADGDAGVAPASNIEGANLMIYYRLGDDPDTTGTDGIQDRSGNDNHATMTGGTIVDDPAVVV